MKDITPILISSLGRLYSEELGIDLDKGREGEVFRWFMASILYGKRISEKIATNTYREFERAGVLTPKAILGAGWRGLVVILDTGGYVRYDFSTADNLLEMAERLLKEYGSLTNLYKRAKDPEDLEKRLQDFKGIGPVTTSIFLRELRHVWKKANPKICPYAIEAAERIGIDLKKMDRKKKDFARLECALLRIDKNYIRKNKPIPMKDQTVH